MTSSRAGCLVIVKNKLFGMIIREHIDVVSRCNVVDVMWLDDLLVAKGYSADRFDFRTDFPHALLM